MYRHMSTRPNHAPPEGASWARAILFANGLVPDAKSLGLAIADTDLLVGVDGGTEHCLAMGIAPHLVVGDMDSLAGEQRARLSREGVRMDVHPVAKDKTDLELAMDLAVEEGVCEVLVVGVWGGRLDQSLANMLLLGRYAGRLRIRFTDGKEHGAVLVGEDELEIQGAKGSVCSLVPVSGLVDRVTVDGVQYPLRNALIHQGDTLAVSNRITSPRASVGIGQGILVVVWFGE